MYLALELLVNCLALPHDLLSCTSDLFIDCNDGTVRGGNGVGTGSNGKVRLGPQTATVLLFSGHSRFDKLGKALLVKLLQAVVSKDESEHL